MERMLGILDLLQGQRDGGLALKAARSMTPELASVTVPFLMAATECLAFSLGAELSLSPFGMSQPARNEQATCE